MGLRGSVAAAAYHADRVLACHFSGLEVVIITSKSMSEGVSVLHLITENGERRVRWRKW